MTTEETRGRPLTLLLSEDVIPAQQFKSAVDAFVEILSEVSAAFVVEKLGEIEWGISVRAGSAVISAIPSSSQPAAIAPLTNAIAKGISALERGGERPQYFSDKALLAVKTLGKIASQDLQVRMEATGVETNISEQSTISVGHVLDAKYSDYGSLDGYLQVLSTRNGIKANLYDDLTDRPISCLFKNFEGGVLDDLFRAMRSRRRVEVSGLISYRSDGHPVRMDVEDFSIFPHQDSLPNIRDIIGIFKADKR